MNVRNYAECRATVTLDGLSRRAIVRWSPLSLGWQRASLEPERGSHGAGPSFALVWRDIPEHGRVTDLEHTTPCSVRAFLIAEHAAYLASCGVPVLPEPFASLPEHAEHAATLEGDEGNAHGVIVRRVGSVVQARRLVITWEDVPADCLPAISLHGRV